ncbi:MAG: ABC transporter permease subunit [Firmicutes bacterium]|nr:ABC transporter permease subunit [Bacillota bacterium]
MKTIFIKLKKNKRVKKYFWITTSIIFMVGLWWILAETFFSQTEVIPTPIEVMRQMGQSAGTRMLWINIWNTLWKVLVTFLVSFLLSFLLAVLAAWRDEARHFISPIVTVLRALPTIGVVFILFMVLRGQNIVAIVIASLMIFPVMYENFYAALKEVDQKLIQLSKVYNISFLKQIRVIYIPHLMPHAFASSIAGIGMGLKIVIAAEILSVTFSNTLGTAMVIANMDGGGMLFMWILVAVLLSFVLEGIVRLIAYFAMPWKRRKGGDSK